MLATLFAAVAVAAAPHSPAEVTVWSADSLAWSEARPGGTQRATLEGNLDGPGIVTYAFHMPDGAWFPAHVHGSTARVFVMKGVLLLGQGASGVRTRVLRVKAGEAVLVPGGQVHYEGAEGETVILGVAEGPWTTRFIGAADRK
jgi:mannose-6-phosphate isomerase-like protein (cupin superfamily)